MQQSISRQIADLVSYLPHIKRCIEVVPAPKDEQEKLILILKGYTKSLVSEDRWVLYQ